MANQLYANNFATTLAADITDSATTLTLTSATGAPTIASGSGDWFMLHLVDADGDYEIVKVTARTTVTCTIVRAQEGTTASAHTLSPVTVISLRITAGTLDKIEAAIEAIEADIVTIESDITTIENGIAGKSSVSVYKSATQSLTIGSTQITFPAETRDTNTEFASSAFTAKTAGLYDIHAVIAVLAPTANTSIIPIIYKNDSNVSQRLNRSGLANETASYQISDTIELIIGDTIKIYLYVGASATVQGSAYTLLTIDAR